MKKYLILCVIVSSFLSCKKDKQEGVVVSLMINLTIESTDGKDLLNPSTPNPIRKEDIQVFFENDGKRETYASRSHAYQLDNPAGFTLNTPVNTFGNNYFLTIFSNDSISNNSVTVVAINGRDDIKLVSEVLKSNGNLRVSKIWYKETLVWPVEGNDGPKYVRITMEQ